MSRPAPISRPRRLSRPNDARPAPLTLAPVALAALMALAGLPVWAQPPATQLPVLKPGAAPINATIAPIAGTAARPVMNITQTPSAANRAVIEWSGFNIGSQATVNIAQPNAQSVLVNRVVHEGTRSASEIYGSLNANGRVFVINPAGVIFGSGAQVNVGSLVASSLDMGSASASNGYRGFLENGSIELVTTGDASSVQAMESAVIRAQPGGSVTLVASQGVTQHGAIEAAQGRVDLAVTPQAAVLALGTSGFVDLVVAPSANRTAGGAIDIGGRIDTSSSSGDGGRVRIDAGPQGSVTLAPGASVRADSSAATGSGGRMEVLGRRIAVQAPPSAGTVTLSADGTRGGGHIEVGDTDTRDLHIAQGALLSAEATGHGNGGTILVRANHRGDGFSRPGAVAREDYGVAEVYGQLRVRGGVTGGNGGFVDTSGTALNTTLFHPDTGTTWNAEVDARARAAGGLTGTWLLDPFDVTISNAASGTGMSAVSPFSPTGAGATLSAASLSAALATANVEVNTGTSGTGIQAGNITVAAGTTLTGAATGNATTLTLRAHNDILFGANTSVTSSGGQLGINLIADSDADGLGNVQLTDTTFSTQGGNVTINGFGTQANTIAGVGLQRSTINAGTGNITINGTTQDDAVGVSIVNSSLQGNNIGILGKTARASAVFLDNSTITTTSGNVEIRGVAARLDGGTGEIIGVQIGTLDIALGSGDLTIAGRADDAFQFSSGGSSPVGLQYNNLRIRTDQGIPGTPLVSGNPKITLAGEVAGSNSTSARGITFLDAEAGGLTLSAGVSGAQDSLHDMELGAITPSGLALDLGTGSGISVRTQGRVNFRPLGVSATGAVTESLDSRITVADLGTQTPGFGEFTVDTRWLQSQYNGAFMTPHSYVIGSQQHNGDIIVGDAAFKDADATGLNQRFVSVTLQNSGPGFNTGEGVIPANVNLGANNAIQDLVIWTGGSVTQNGPLTVLRNLWLRANEVALTNPQNRINNVNFDAPGALSIELAAQGPLSLDTFGSFAPYFYDTQNHDYPVLSPVPTPGNRNANAVGAFTSVRSTGPVTVNIPIDIYATGPATVDISSTGQVVLGPNFEFTSERQALEAQDLARIWSPVITGSVGARNLYGCVFGDAGNCSVSNITLPSTGRLDLYPTQPTVTLSASSTGTDAQGNPVVTLTQTGLINGDTIANSITGAPDPLPGSTNGTVNFSRGDLASPNGYLINFIGGTGNAVPAVNFLDPVRTIQAVSSAYIAQAHSDVYGRNLAMPSVCTASSVIRETLARETTADPLASEWGKVRGQPHLSGCLEVVDGGQCAAF